jgi:hypothetical protein
LRGARGLETVRGIEGADLDFRVREVESISYSSISESYETLLAEVAYQPRNALVNQ